MQVVVNKSFDILQQYSLKNKKRLMEHQRSFYDNVFQCLQPNPSNLTSTSSLPLADLLRQYYEYDGVFLVASLIHWEATHNDVRITNSDDSLKINEKESQKLFLVVRNFLKENYDLELIYHDHITWLIRLKKQHPSISSVSIDAIQNHSLMPILQQLDRSFFWQKLLTELQMLLSTHFKEKPKMMVNGIWIWGEGEFKPFITQHLKATIVTDDEILLKVFASIPNKNVKIKKLRDYLIPHNNDRIFIKYPDLIDLKQLAEKIKNNTVQWHWNNFCYSVPASGWRRLWRK